MGLLSWIVPGNDHQLAATQYAGRESASDRAARKRREGHRRNIAKTTAKAEKWGRRDRAQDKKGPWYTAAR